MRIFFVFLAFLFFCFQIKSKYYWPYKYVVLNPVNKQIIGFPSKNDTLIFDDIKLKSSFFDRLKIDDASVDKIEFKIDNSQFTNEDKALYRKCKILSCYLFKDSTLVRSIKIFSNSYYIWFRVNKCLNMNSFFLKCYIPKTQIVIDKKQ